MANRSPMREEINVHDSLDERSAVKNFLGKNLTEAQELFRENFRYYQEDLMWMGPRAFCYYVRAAIAHLLDPGVMTDRDDVDWFCSGVEFCLDYSEPGEIAESILALRAGFEHILACFGRYDGDSEIDAGSCGDVRARCLALLSRLYQFPLSAP